MIRHTLEKFKNFKADKIFEELFKKASEIFRKNGIFMMTIQNVEYPNQLKYYRENLFELLIDQFINDFEIMDSENQRKTAKLSLMIEKKTERNELLETFNHYHEILPSGIDASQCSEIQDKSWDKNSGFGIYFIPTPGD